MDLYLYEKTDPSIKVELSNVYLTADDQYISSKKVSKGRWYYEYTHNSGQSNYDMIGFITTSDYITYYKMNKTIDYSLYTHGCSTWTTNYKIITTLNTEEVTTIGIMLDIDNGVFSLRAGNEVSIFPFTCTSGNTQWTVFVGHATVVNRYSIVSVNYGQSDFLYGLPSGYTAWIDDYLVESQCGQKGRPGVILLFINCLIFP